jgi:hypothetical protein
MFMPEATHMRDVMRAIMVVETFSLFPGIDLWLIPRKDGSYTMVMDYRVALSRLAGRGDYRINFGYDAVKSGETTRVSTKPLSCTFTFYPKDALAPGAPADKPWSYTVYDSELPPSGPVLAREPHLRLRKAAIGRGARELGAFLLGGELPNLPVEESEDAATAQVEAGTEDTGTRDIPSAKRT